MPAALVSARVHPSAVVGGEVELGPGVEVGPFCLIDGRVKIGAGTRLISHVAVFGVAELGEMNVLHPGVVIGDEPQDLEYSGAPRAVRIGNRNVFRESVTVHRGSEKGEITIVGDDNFLMANAHVGHDCRLGNNIIITNGTLLGGWVQLADGVNISGNCALHQYVRVGRFAMFRGLTRASRDVPPFCLIDDTHVVRSINVVGLRRAGFSGASIMALRKAFAALFRTRLNMRQAIEHLLAAGPPTSEVAELIEFIRTSKRGVAFGPRRDDANGDDGE